MCTYIISVPLISNGFMCAKGWKTKLFNPGNVKVLCVEYKHDPVPFIRDARGGPHTGDHGIFHKFLFN